MRTFIAISFLLLPCLAFSQAEQDKTVIFGSQVVADDSFYVLQTTYIPGAGRIDTLKEFEFFRDTTSLKNYRDNFRQQVDALFERIRFLRTEYDSLNSRLLELDTVVADIISTVGGEVSREHYSLSEENPTYAQPVLYFMTRSRHNKRRRKKYP